MQLFYVFIIYLKVIRHIMLSNIAICPVAQVILVLIIIINILSIYLTITYNLVLEKFSANIILLLFTVFTIIILIWLANKTCNNYKWVSGLIILYLFYELYNTIVLIVDPKKRGELISMISDIDRMVA
jgi:hypothetical protein